MEIEVLAHMLDKSFLESYSYLWISVTEIQDKDETIWVLSHMGFVFYFHSSR